ncbi:YcaO-like family protein [Haloferacaceae archaeon DSL9]
MHLERPDRLVPPLLQRALGTRTGLLSGVYLTHPARSDPTIAVSRPDTADLSTLVDADGALELGLSGKGETVQQTLTSSIGETVERYCMCWPPEAAELVEASYETLAASDPVVDWEHLAVFGDTFREAHLASLSRGTTLYWAEGTNLSTGEPIYVPAEYVWMRVGSLADVPSHFLGSSSGCAAGPSLPDAVTRAFLELVERDAFMRAWCTQSTPRSISLEAFPSVDALRTERFTERGLTAELFAFESPVDLPTVGAALYDDGREGPSFVMGGGAGLTPTEAMRDALCEVGQGWPYLRSLATRHDLDSADAGSAIDNFDENVLYYSLPDNRDEVAFLLSGDDCESLPRAPPVEGDREALRSVLDRIRAAGGTPIAFDITTPDVRQLGVSVARVVVPEFVPLSPPAALPIAHPAFDGESVTDRPHPYP